MSYKIPPNALKDIGILFAMVLFTTWIGLSSTGELQPKWQPPIGQNLTSESGELIPYKACSYNDINCVKAYGFKTSNGLMILLNCEPAPPINKCFDEYIANTQELYGKKIEIKHFQLGSGKADDDYKLVMSASINGNNIFNYNDRLNYIQSTKTLSSKIGNSSRIKRSNLISFWITVINFLMFILLSYFSLFPRKIDVKP